MAEHAHSNAVVVDRRAGSWVTALLDVKLLTAAGGLILAGYLIYLNNEATTNQFKEINGTMKEMAAAIRASTEVQVEFVRVQVEMKGVIEANTKVMEAVLRSSR